MNAKKIMGAVLVALLAAALFVGAASAADVNKGTVFVYENTTLAGVGLEDGVWTSANGAQVSITNGVVYPGDNFVAGDYKYNGTVVYVTYPTATYSIEAELDGADYIVLNGGNVFLDSNLTFGIAPAAKNMTIEYVMVDGVKYTKTAFDALVADKFTQEAKTYTIQAVFAKTNFVAGVPDNLLLDTVSKLTYKVVEADDATISANVDTVYQDESVKLTIKGTPGTVYVLNGTGFTVANNQFVTVNAFAPWGYNVTMSNTGEVSFNAKIVGTEKATIKLYYENETKAVLPVDDGEIEVKISKPVLTVAAEKSSYFIGNDVVITGTSTSKVSETTYDYYISGVNFKATKLEIDDFEEGKNFKIVLETEDVNETGTSKKLDVGTYTISLVKQGVVYNETNVVKTVAVALKQPFISIIEAPEVIVQETEADFVINAEASEAGIQWYIFGTNYFNKGEVTTADDKDTPSQFTVELTEGTTKGMAAGQYFAVFQHPMYDQKFQIKADGTDIVLIDYVASTQADLFNVYDRQTANAAQALCDALDSQNFDDMYVKYSFFVVGEDESFVISDIPSQIAKGDKLVISGVSTTNAEDTVTVEMISTAFAAVPKETVGSAAFIVATAEVAEDGTWEITLDTSDLNVDEYSVKVACEGTTWKNVNVNVVAAGDEPVNPEQPEEPEQPEQPEEPVAPATPGFGALAALAGLGAVAVLLLRRE